MALFKTFLLCLALAIFGQYAEASNPKELSKLEKLAYDEFLKWADGLKISPTSRETSTATWGRKTGMNARASLLGSFSYKNCADAADEVVVPSDITLVPDPIKLPGNITAAGSVQVKEGFDTPVKLELVIDVKILGLWVYVPCVDNIGSCTYDDLCDLLKDVTCPEAMTDIGMPCKCPFIEGQWTIDDLSIYIDLSLPVSGELKVKANAYSDDKLLTCAEVELKVE